MSQTDTSSKASLGALSPKPATNYRWVIMAIIFITYAINFADRTNIGVALPFITKDFHLSNFEAGSLASMFFLGYAVSQIPAGFWFSKFGTRGLVSLSIFGFSFFTYLIGSAGSALGIKWARFGLGWPKGPPLSVAHPPSITGFLQKKKQPRRASTLPRPCSLRFLFLPCACGLPSPMGGAISFIASRFPALRWRLYGICS